MLPHLQYHLRNPHKCLLEEVSYSALMKDILLKARTLAELDNPLIIIGEIGSGKKRLARYIHRYSLRKESPFHCFYCVDVNESEYKEAFWEHVEIQGSHIVLTYDAIEKARGGFLFLDQFSEVKEQFMLDIIESYQQGCNQLYKYNSLLAPRLVLAINRETYRKLLGSAVWKSIIDLLNPLAIMVPPLRERREDIPKLVDIFLQNIRDIRAEWVNLTISKQALDKCVNYNWPGNVRQLKNALLQGAVLSNGNRIEIHHLPFSLNWHLPYRAGKD